MKYYIIAGEASGDLHGSNLMKGIKKVDPAAEFRFWGGEKMLAVGGEMVKDYREGNFMGFLEVVINLRKILRNIRFCKTDIEEYKPDVLILIDYPGFNLKVARFAKSINLKVFYYISPKIWAWKESRIKTIKAYVDKMFVIFPFEEEFYKKFDYPVIFRGNPLIDEIEAYKKNVESWDEFKVKNKLDERPVIALLPGSRKQEIDKTLAIMKSIQNRYESYQFVIAAATSIEDAYYSKYIDSNTKIVFQQTYTLFHYAFAAIVTSGTATLEAALFDVPQVVGYRAGKISYFIGKILVKVKYISLVNLIMNKEVVKELIQSEMNSKKLSKEMDLLIDNNEYRAKILKDYSELRRVLGGKGTSVKVAEEMVRQMKK